MKGPNNEHIPTDATRAQAESAAGLGLPHDQIGALLGIIVTGKQIGRVHV